MKISRFMIPTLKEVPAEATIASHQLMLRAGLIRKMSSGIYAYLPLGLRALRKLMTLIREEMDRAGAQEYALPLLLERALWEETGRYGVMGDLMMKVQDRGKNDFVLAPTHEEGFTHIIRGELQSYKQLPFTVYQIGKKFRDEIRPRFGVMRGREFIMKDAYSYDRDETDLEASYQAMRQAYRRIFQRVGLQTVGVRADSGAMGGSGSEEFMVPSQVGENEIITCEECGYAANAETAVCRNSDPGAKKQADTPSLEKVSTPGVRTIDELCVFFSCGPERFVKTLIYRVLREEGETRVMVLIRGDYDVNEVKLTNHLQAVEVELAGENLVRDITGAAVGFAGPVAVDGVTIIADHSVAGLRDAITGANEDGQHLKHVEPGRDFRLPETVDLRLVKAGDRCVECGGVLDSFRGIEVGHIFKLGDKYTRSMSVHFLDEQGNEATPLMGCYGIGVDRTLASVIEHNHDQDGIIWPRSLAPFQVLIVPVKYEDEQLRAAADRLYDQLWDAGIETLLDDRDARAGFKFKDGDLIGIPVRVTVGTRGLEQGKLEVKLRAGSETHMLPLQDPVPAIKELLHTLDGQETR